MKEIPIFTVIGWSNTGKTTLIGRLIELYNSQGLKAAALKRTHEHIKTDDEGSDSWSYGQRGAFGTALATPEGGTFYFPDFNWSAESLRQVFNGADVIICEGLRLKGYPLIQTAGRTINISELKGESDEWTAVISDQPDLRKELQRQGIRVIGSEEYILIPEIILRNQPGKKTENEMD